MHVPCRLSKVMDAFLKGIFSSSPFPAPLLSTSAFSPPSLPDVLAGYNGTIFAYGQTSSGKTHTMEVRILTSMKGEERGVWRRQEWWLGVWQDHNKIFLFTLLKLIDCGISYAFKTFFF